MIGGTPKPFACTTEGCTMTFTNEDHLNVHQRKHEMVLNFGLKNTNIVADQTPTPTRFLRNCEEVGLFQDLQNVNPFEETFRKAVELNKNGTLLVSHLPEDDTLHTPHIFPHIPEENISLYSSKKHEKVLLNVVESTENSSSKILSNSEKTETILTLNNNNNHGIPDHIYALTPVENQKEPPTIIISDSPEPEAKKNSSTSSVIKSNEIHAKTEKTITKAKYRKYAGNINVKTKQITTTKSKLQELLLKSKKPICTSASPLIVLQSVPCVNSVPILQTVGKVPILPKFKTSVYTSEKLAENTQPTPNESVIKTVKKSVSKSRKNYVDHDSNKKQDMLARNRAAALRCREKKKIFIDSLEQQLDVVNKEKQVLVKENSDLKREIVHLKTLLLAHKDCPVTKAMNMGQSIPIGVPQIVEVPMTKSNEGKIEAKQAEGTSVTISICDLKHLSTDTSPKSNILVWED